MKKVPNYLKVQKERKTTIDRKRGQLQKQSEFLANYGRSINAEHVEPTKLKEYLELYASTEDKLSDTRAEMQKEVEGSHKKISRLRLDVAATYDSNRRSKVVVTHHRTERRRFRPDSQCHHHRARILCP